MRVVLHAGLFAFAGSIALTASCASKPPIEDPKHTSTGDAFGDGEGGGVKCSAVRPQTEPDLMGWDPGSRANLAMLRTQGVVAVRYHAEGCNVELEVLSNCIGKGTYTYAPYAATDTKIAHNSQELFASLPLGAAKLGGKLRGGRALRTDYTLVGMQTLPAGSSYVATDLRGQDCSRATHVVSRVYVGGFAMIAGESRSIEASAHIFSAGAGGRDDRNAEHVAREGVAEACAAAQADGKESTQCAVPLRVGLLTIERGGALVSGGGGGLGASSAVLPTTSPTPDAGSVPSEPSSQTIANTLGAINIQSCKKADTPSGAGHAMIVFERDGSVQSVTIDQGVFKDTAVGACVAGKYRGARIPPFGGARMTIGKSFMIH